MQLAGEVVPLESENKQLIEHRERALGIAFARLICMLPNAAKHGFRFAARQCIPVVALPPYVNVSCSAPSQLALSGLGCGLPSELAVFAFRVISIDQTCVMFSRNFLHFVVTGTSSRRG